MRSTMREVNNKEVNNKGQQQTCNTNNNNNNNADLPTTRDANSSDNNLRTNKLDYVFVEFVRLLLEQLGVVFGRRPHLLHNLQRPQAECLEGVRGQVLWEKNSK